MNMIGNQRPGVAVGIGFDEKGRETIDKILTIRIVPEDIPTFDTANDNMLQKAGDVEARLAWHGGTVAEAGALFNN